MLFTSCGSSKLKDISYSELNKKLKNNETFFFVVTRDGCQHCEKYIPKVEEVLEEYDIVGYNLNYSDLSEEEDEEFYNTYGIGSTPTTVFIKDGEEETTATRIEGDVSVERLTDKLKKNGFIK
jgi:predicted bacteriocin transport accessory protein